MTSMISIIYIYTFIMSFIYGDKIDITVYYVSRVQTVYQLEKRKKKSCSSGRPCLRLASGAPMGSSNGQGQPLGAFSACIHALAL